MPNTSFANPALIYETVFDSGGRLIQFDGAPSAVAFIGLGACGGLPRRPAVKTHHWRDYWAARGACLGRCSYGGPLACLAKPRVAVSTPSNRAPGTGGLLRSCFLDVAHSTPGSLCADIKR